MLNHSCRGFVIFTVYYIQHHYTSIIYVINRFFTAISTLLQRIFINRISVVKVKFHLKLQNKRRNAIYSPARKNSFYLTSSLDVLSLARARKREGSSSGVAAASLRKRKQKNCTYVRERHKVRV